MSKQFSVMKLEVGNAVGDTSTAFLTLVGSYINNRYREFLRRTNWEAVNDAYTFDTVAGTQDYTAPTDFGKEMYLYDSTNGIPIASTSLQGLLVKNQGNMTDQGSPSEYVVLDGYSAGARTKEIRLFPIPAGVYTIWMPYILKATDLSGDSDITIIDCEDAVVLGATADAWRYKRQFAKATTVEALFEKSINSHIWDRVNQPNQVTMFNIKPYSRDTV